MDGASLPIRHYSFKILQVHVLSAMGRGGGGKGNKENTGPGNDNGGGNNWGIIPGIIPGQPALGLSATGPSLLPMFQQAAGAANVVGGTILAATTHEREAFAARHLMERMGIAAGGIAGAGAVPGAATGATTAAPAASAPPPSSTTALDQATFSELLEASELFKRLQSHR